jgi:tetratricopeptide (TPR) repeat protein
MLRMQKAARSLAVFISIVVVQSPLFAEDEIAAGATTADATSSSYINRATFNATSSAENEVVRLFALYQDARSASMQEEADSLAKQIVEVSIRSYGRESNGTAKALTNLAMLQSENDELVPAIQNLSAAIDIVERTENRLSSELINPLKALGIAQLQAGNTDLAKAAWYRAVHISHVNLGPHNYEQVETLHALARMFSSAGMAKEARKTYKRISYLKSREFQPRADGMLPELYE